MNYDQLASLDFSDFETTEQWTKLLNSLIGLAQAGGTTLQLNLLADKLDEFADESSSVDLDAIIKLDRIARKTARALRLQDITEKVKELQRTASDFQDVVKEFDSATAALRKEASLLRAEKFTQAASSLTQTIASLKALSQAVADGDDKGLGTAIAEATASAQKLRALLEEH